MDQASSTWDNIQRFLEWHQIRGLVLDSSHPGNDPKVPGYDPSRCYLLDIGGELLTHCTAHPSLWSRDMAKGIDTCFHGPGVRASFRSRTTPSMQVCVREIHVPTDGNGRPQRISTHCLLEVDFDEHSPNVNFIGHAKEVAIHAIRGTHTNPAVIQSGLDKLLA